MLHTQTVKDILELHLIADAAGITDDVRDLLFIRSAQKWEFGISAKNNHRAVKHSRLSDQINFGKQWLAFDCSTNYFSRILPIFTELRKLKKQGHKWQELENKQVDFYLPILKAFKEELLSLERNHLGLVTPKLLTYLIGNKDFYKVIKHPHHTEISAFNLYGTLGTSIQKQTSKLKQLKLPKRIIDA